MASTAAAGQQHLLTGDEVRRHQMQRNGPVFDRGVAREVFGSPALTARSSTMLARRLKPSRRGNTAPRRPVVHAVEGARPSPCAKSAGRLRRHPGRRRPARPRRRRRRCSPPRCRSERPARNSTFTTPNAAAHLSEPEPSTSATLRRRRGRPAVSGGRARKAYGGRHLSRSYADRAIAAAWPARPLR